MKYYLSLLYVKFHLQITMNRRSTHTHQDALLSSFNFQIQHQNKEEALEIESNSNELLQSTDEFAIAAKCNLGKIKFDAEMKKHGLCDNISQMEELRRKISSIIGPLNKPDNAVTRTLFPFQKRNRNSEQLQHSNLNSFNSQKSGSAIPCKALPVLSRNFAICPSAKDRWDLIDNQENSIKYNKEEPKQQLDDVDEWMYKSWCQLGLSADYCKEVTASIRVDM